MQYYLQFTLSEIYDRHRPNVCEKFHQVDRKAYNQSNFNTGIMSVSKLGLCQICNVKLVSNLKTLLLIQV